MIEFHNVTKNYHKRNGIFNVSFTINRNDFVILSGENGSGKTTTIKLILSFLRLNSHDGGSITNEFKSISYIPERIVLPPFIKGKEFIEDLLKLQKNEIDYQSYFDYLGLDSSIMIGSYSKGMRQKLGIIQALVSTSELVLLDEPLTGLDEATQGKVFNLLKELKGKKTVVISTHNSLLFESLSNKHLHFEAGRLVSITHY